MPVATTPAYITTVRSDRTIVLPDEMAVGDTIAVIALPSILNNDNTVRTERFETTVDAIRAASGIEDGVPTISDERLDELIKKARRSSAA